MSPLCRAKDPKTISPAPEPPPQSLCPQISPTPNRLSEQEASCRSRPALPTPSSDNERQLPCPQLPQRLPEPPKTATLHPPPPPPLSPRHSPASPRENDDKPAPLPLHPDEEPCAPNQLPCCPRRSLSPASLQKAPLRHCLPNLRPAKKERRDIPPQHPRPLSLNAEAHEPLSPKIPRCIPRQKACLCPVQDYLTVNQPT